MKSFPSFPMKLPVAVMMEHRDRIEPGRLVELGPGYARVRTKRRLRRGDSVVITISVPEATTEKTQALFRLHSSVREWTRVEEAEGACLLDFETEGRNLTSATELLVRFRKRGLIDQ
jgi:hypothetical protein